MRQKTINLRNQGSFDKKIVFFPQTLSHIPRWVRFVQKTRAKNSHAWAPLKEGRFQFVIFSVFLKFFDVLWCHVVWHLRLINVTYVVCFCSETVYVVWHICFVTPTFCVFYVVYSTTTFSYGYVKWRLHYVMLRFAAAPIFYLI